MRLTLLRLAAFVFLIAAAPDPAGASSDWTEAAQSRVRLVPAGRIAYEGRLASFAAIEIALDPGWKTYWRTPGDGLAAEFDWSGSENLNSAEVLWPAPARLDQGLGTAAIGYKDRVVLPVLLDPRDGAAPIGLVLRFVYGVCADICIPVEITLRATIAADDSNGAGGDRDLVLAALARVPKLQNQGVYCPHSLIAAKRRTVGGKPALVIKTAFDERATGLDLFAEATDGIALPQPARQPYDTRGRAYFVSMFETEEDADAVRGEPLRFTLVSDQGSCETALRVK
jgi:DsbC/DsbD-like thiol-disulfide interchange protein